MSNKSKFIAAAGAVAMATAAFVAIPAKAENMKQEKCYGIVKAGKNDCGAADGSHSCAGYSKIEGGKQEWILLPAGTCDRILGASMEPGK